MKIPKEHNVVVLDENNQFIRSYRRDTMPREPVELLVAPKKQIRAEVNVARGLFE